MKEGDRAVDFSLKDSSGKPHKLSDYRGKKVILYFYPRDSTPGCIKEACNFRDDSEKYSKYNSVILGISSDSIEPHNKFKRKHALLFTLLSDPEKEIIKKYGALKKKSLFGNTFLGVIRSTFVIDENGIIIKIFQKVKVPGHSKEILELISKKPSL